LRDVPVEHARSPPGRVSDWRDSRSTLASCTGKTASPSPPPVLLHMLPCTAVRFRQPAAFIIYHGIFASEPRAVLTHRADPDTDTAGGDVPLCKRLRPRGAGLL